MLTGILTVWLLLVLGDFLSTFFYHVPSHVFGKFHSLIHHSPNRNYFHYAVLSRDPWVMLDGLLGVLPYLVLAILLWPLSPVGVVIGLILGQCHVWWRHTTALQWKTPPLIQRLCQILGITTPEIHWLHHHDANTAYGDVFTFLDLPARAWLKVLRYLRGRFYTPSTDT